MARSTAFKTSKRISGCPNWASKAKSMCRPTFVEQKHVVSESRIFAIDFLLTDFLTSDAKSEYMPLELKTGRASFSSEHTGQLIIYQMMLSEIRSTPVDGGLLLYLRQGVMRQVKGNRNEQRDLILLRNEVAYYLSKQQESYAALCASSDSDFDVQFKRLTVRPELPEPINHHSACQNCPYQVLCSMYLGQNPEMMSTLSKQHPLREMASLVTCHLTEAHIEYFCRWVGLLALEDIEAKKCRQTEIAMDDSWI